MLIFYIKTINNYKGFSMDFLQLAKKISACKFKEVKVEKE